MFDDYKNAAQKIITDNQNPNSPLNPLLDEKFETSEKLFSF